MAGAAERRLRLLRWRGRRLLICRPNASAYGHLVVEMLMALHLARSRRAAIYFLKPSRRVNDAVFELDSPDVPTLSRGPLVTAAIGALWALGALTAIPGLVATAFARGFWRWKRLPKSARGRLKAWTATTPQSVSFFGREFRRLYAREPIRVVLPGRLSRVAAAEATAAGIAPDARIVALHVRESGFKVAGGGQESEADASRNARIETYAAAVDWLVERGYTVARIGDPWMTPFGRPGVVDVATSAGRTELLELWCLMQSQFFIGCDSGPYCASLLTGTPCLAVNVTNVLGAFPVRPGDRYILKHVVDRKAGRALRLTEIVAENYLLNRLDFRRYCYVDNTGEEILEAVQEMVRDLAEPREATPAQMRFRALVERLMQSPAVMNKWVRLVHPETPYLGDGRIVHGFAERGLAGGLVEGAVLA